MEWIPMRKKPERTLVQSPFREGELLTYTEFFAGHCIKGNHCQVGDFPKAT